MKKKTVTKSVEVNEFEPNDVELVFTDSGPGSLEPNDPWVECRSKEDRSHTVSLPLRFIEGGDKMTPKELREFMAGRLSAHVAGEELSELTAHTEWATKAQAEADAKAAAEEAAAKAAAEAAARKPSAPGRMFP